MDRSLDKYTSITKSFRGFHYKKEFDSSDEWSSEMLKQSEKDNEVEWSILINLDFGLPTHKYARGFGIRNLECKP